MMKNRPLHQRTLDVAEGILHPREQGYRWKPLQSCLAACSLWYTTVSTASSSRVISRYSPGKRISSISFVTCTASTLCYVGFDTYGGEFAVLFAKGDGSLQCHRDAQPRSLDSCLCHIGARCLPSCCPALCTELRCSEA